MKIIFLNTTGASSIITMCIISIILVLCNLYVSHATNAQQANRCKWKLLNNFAATGIANINTISSLAANDDALFKIICNIQELNDTLVNFIEANSDVFKERAFNKINQMLLRCSIDESLNEIEFTNSDIFLDNHFAHLDQLSIQYCRLKRLPDNMFTHLRELRELAIHNTNITSLSSNLELFSSTFKGLQKLTALDLSWNNIWSVPSNIFCTMQKLEKLVISHNSLNELTQLDFSQSSSSIGYDNEPCTYYNLEILDVSHNKVVYVASFDLYKLKNLKVLLLEHNHIQEIYENGLAGLYELTYINLSHNKIVALPQTLFKSSRNLVKLNLRNNSLSMLTPSIFDALNKLEVLDLSQNYFVSTWINGFIFAKLKHLIKLNIAHNTLQRLDEFLFHDTRNLQVLELQNNEINWIHEKAFVYLNELTVLNLAHNKLKSLDVPFFLENNKLIQLSLESNVITNIENEFFKHLSLLQDLNLSGNLLTEISRGLGYMHSLKSLDLGKNNIYYIDGTRFDGLYNLLGLRLVDNYISNISHTSFQYLSSLQILNLASNRIKHIHKNAFIHNTMMHALRLNNNQLENTFGLFKSLKLLIWLDIGFNDVYEFNFHDIPINIKELNLQDNKIAHIPAQAFLERTQLKKVNIKNNEIQRINREAVRIFPDNASLPSNSNNLSMPEIFLDENPLVCDCNTEWFKESSIHNGYPIIKNLFNITCMIDPFRQTMETKYISKAIYDRFLCRYETHCFNNCQCCDFDACDCKYACPRGCDCFHDEFWYINIVDCGRAEYFDVPKSIPMDATEIYLDGNDMGQLGEHILLGKKNLEVLFLNTSQITTIHNRTFVGIPKLKKLHLENNFIENVNSAIFESLELLVEIYLGSNLLQTIPYGLFTKQTQLKIIGLSNNRLKSLEFINSLPSSVVLSSSFFKENLWDCECLLTSNPKIIKLFKKLCPSSKCGYPLQVNASPVSDQLLKQEYLQLWAAVVVCIIGTTFLLALACNFRSNFYLYVYKTYNIKLQKDPTERLDIHKVYDATIIYNNRDSNFIHQIFTIKLSEFKLHYQNHILENSTNNSGTSDIQSLPVFSNDNFISGLEMSKRLIIIFSGNFLNIEWKHQAFRIALKNYLDRLKPCIRPYRILMILSVPLDIILLDPILEEMIKSCSVLFWGEQQFWEKLFYALPIINHHKYNNIDLNQKLCGHNNRHKQTILEHPQHTKLLDMENNKNNTPNEDNLSFSGLSQTQSYKFYNAQTYVHKATGHIYTTIEETNGRSQTTTNTTTSSDVTDNGKAYFV